MADFSVIGEIIGETNLDEVADSVERSLQDAAEAAGTTSGATEDMEKSMDSATEAVASLAGASSEADDQLEEVEAEMEDIVTDAGAATGSVTLLGSTLEGIDGMDVDIDVDDDIDAINAQWANMRNEIDDFEHRVDDIIPQRAGGAPVEDFLGDQREFEGALEALDEAQDSMDEIADARRQAFGDEGPGGRDLDRPFRQLPEGFGGSERTRSNIIDALDFSDTEGGLRQGPANVGGLLSRTDERTAGKLAGAIASLDEVSSSQQDVLRALNREVIAGGGPTIDIADTDEIVPADAFDDPVREGFIEGIGDVDRVPALPAPDDDDGIGGRTFGPDMAGGRIGVPSRAFQTPAVGRGSMEGRMPFDEVMEVEPGAFGEGFLGMSQSDLGLGDRAELIDMGEMEFDQLIDGLDEPVTMAQDGLRDFHNTTDEATDSSSRLSNALDDASTRLRNVGTRARARVGGTAADAARGGIRGDIMDIRAGGGGDRGRGFRRTREALDDLSKAAVQSNTTLGFLISTMTFASGSAKNMEHAVEELDDDVEDLARSLAAASPAVQNLSANLGPFNVSMSNLLVTIPTLIAVVGPFIAVLAGLAGALIGVVGAFGALLAVGAIDFIEDMKNNFAGIETTGEAVMAIMRGLKQSIMEALAPLESVEIGGLGAQGLFVTVLQDIVTLIHLFAEAAAELLNMQVVEDFLLNMRAAVLGFSDATESGMTMIEGLKKGMEGALPILEDFLIWLIDVFPEFIAFTGEITKKAAPAMAEFAQAILRLSTLLTEAGSGAMNVLFPALALVFDVLSVLLAGMIAFERMMGEVSSVFIAVAGGGLFLAAALVKLAGTLDSAFEAANTVTQTIDAMNGAVSESDTVFQAYGKAVRNTNSSMVRFAHLSLVAMGRMIVLAAGIYLVLDALGLLEPLISAISDNLGPLVTGITEATTAMGEAIGIGDTLTRVIEFMVGLFLIAVPLIATGFTGSMWSAVVAMGGFITTAWGVVGVMSAFITELIVSTGGLWGLISAETTATIVTEGFTGAVWSAVASLSALQIVTGIAVVAAIALLASEMLGFTDVLDDVTEAVLAAITAITVAFLGSGWGATIVAVGLLIAALIKLEQIVGPAATAVIAAIGAITAALLGSGWGAAIVALGLGITAIVMLAKKFGWAKALIVAAIAAITIALVSSGWGAIIVAIGLLLAGLVLYWEDLVAIVESAVSWFDNLGVAGKLAIMAVLAPIAPLIAGLLAVREAIGLILNPQKRQKWWNAIQSGLDGLMNTIKGIIDWVILLFTDPMAAIGQLFSWIKSGIQNILSRIGGQSGREGGGDGIEGTGSSVLAGAAAGAAAGSVIPGAGTVGGAVVGGTAGLVDEHVVDLPVLQKGGFINSPGLAYLHSNEMVVPNKMFADATVNRGANLGGGRGGGGGGGAPMNVTVNIDNAGGDIDDRRARQIGNITRRSIREQRRLEDGR